jgi:hypothetical protein
MPVYGPQTAIPCPRCMDARTVPDAPSDFVWDGNPENAPDMVDCPACTVPEPIDCEIRVCECGNDFYARVPTMRGKWGRLCGSCLRDHI